MISLWSLHYLSVKTIFPHLFIFLLVSHHSEVTWGFIWRRQDPAVCLVGPLFSLHKVDVWPWFWNCLMGAENQIRPKGHLPTWDLGGAPAGAYTSSIWDLSVWCGLDGECSRRKGHQIVIEMFQSWWCSRIEADNPYTTNTTASDGKNKLTDPRQDRQTDI